MEAVSSSPVYASQRLGERIVTRLCIDLCQGQNAVSTVVQLLSLLSFLTIVINEIVIKVHNKKILRIIKYETEYRHVKREK